MEYLIPIMAAAVRSGTPILFATLGELLTERVGVMNLGLEGIMLMGSLSGFWGALVFSNPWAGIALAVLVGMALSALHAVLCVSLGANQVVSGLALAMFGTGTSALLGKNLVGVTIPGLPAAPLPGLAELPWVGPILFSHDVLVYGGFILTAFLAWFLYFTRGGLNLRAAGEAPRVVDAAGLSAVRLRYLYTILGGGLVGLGGAYMSVVYTKMWAEMMTAGRGWIALALVIFGLWHPVRSALGAYFFGGVGALQLRMQAGGTTVPAPLLMMLPYVMTIAVLFVIAVRKGYAVSMGAPRSLGVPYHREERDG